MNLYDFRNFEIFKITLFIQRSLDCSKNKIFGIPLDWIMHFLVPLLIYFLLCKVRMTKFALPITLLIIILKECNDFYIYYYYMDIKVRYLLSSLIDLCVSMLGLVSIHYAYHRLGNKSLFGR